MNKKIFKLLFLSVLFINLLFFNMDLIAAKINNNNGYAFCTYTWTQEGRAQSTQHSSEGVETSYVYSYVVGFVAHKENNEIIISKPNVDCWAEGNKCSVYKYDLLEKGLKSYYNEQDNWDCPGSIYVDHDGVGQGDLLKVNFSTERDFNFNIEAKISSKDVSDDGSYKTALEKLKKIKATTGSANTTYIGAGTPPPGVDNIYIVKDIDINDIVAFNADFEEADTGGIDCNLISDSVMKKLKDLFLIIQIFGVILLIIMSMIEFIKVLTKSDDNDMKQAVKNTYRRIIVAVVLLTLPMFIIWGLNIINENAYATDENGKRIIGEDGDPICSGDGSSSSNSSSNSSSSSSSSNTSNNSKNEKGSVNIRLDRTTLALDKSRKKFGVINAVLSKDGIYSAKDIKWTISNTSIVKFRNGNKNVLKTTGFNVKLVALKKGKVNVTAMLPNGRKASCVVKVIKMVTSVKLDRSYYILSKGSKVTLKATVTPSNATNKKIAWTSSNPRVASVNSKGKVVGKKIGTAIITATARDGSNKKATCIIDVKKVQKIDKKKMTLVTKRMGGGIETDTGIQGFCIVDKYIVMAIVRDENATIYLVNKQNFHIYDSINIGSNHANVLSYDSKNKVIFVGNTGQRPVTLKIKNNKLQKVKNKITRSGQILYNEKNDWFITANGGSVKVYTRDAFYNKGKAIKSFSMSGLGGYVPQGKGTFGDHVYYCLSRDSRGKNVILVYNITTGKLEQTIYDYTKSDTMAELEQAYFDSSGNMYTNYNHGNDIYKTNYNYYKQLK